MVLVQTDGVFRNGGEGGGLIGLLSALLDRGDQFQHLIAETNAVLLEAARVLPCHFGCGLSGWSDGEDRRHQQGIGSALDDSLWVSVIRELWHSALGNGCLGQY